MLHLLLEAQLLPALELPTRCLVQHLKAAAAHFCASAASAFGLMFGPTGNFGSGGGASGGAAAAAGGMFAAAAFPRSSCSSSTFDSPGPYSAASAGASASAAHAHPDLPQELLQRIENNDPALTELKMVGKSDFKEAGCRILARALSLNTCITSLNLLATTITPAGAALLSPALTHLTTTTCLNLWGTDLQSSGASLLCRTLAHLTAHSS